MSKKKIIVISDHALSTSGVGIQTRHLLNGLILSVNVFFDLSKILWNMPVILLISIILCLRNSFMCNKSFNWKET